MQVAFQMWSVGWSKVEGRIRCVSGRGSSRTGEKRGGQLFICDFTPGHSPTATWKIQKGVEYTVAPPISLTNKSFPARGHANTVTFLSTASISPPSWSWDPSSNTTLLPGRMNWRLGTDREMGQRKHLWRNLLYSAHRTTWGCLSSQQANEKWGPWVPDSKWLGSALAYF